MNKKGVKKIKHNTSQAQKVPFLEKGDGSKLFVLPPMVLKEMGIHLEMINKFNAKKGFQYNNDGGGIQPLNKFQVENTMIGPEIQSNIPDGSSMLETANLMKNSVFLSPTFSCNVAHQIPEEISNTITESETNCVMEDVDIMSHVDKNDKISLDYTVVPFPDKVDIENIMSATELHNTKGIFEKDICDDFRDHHKYLDCHERQDQDVSLSNTGDMAKSFGFTHNTASVEYQPDVAYTSDSTHLGPDDCAEKFSRNPENIFSNKQVMHSKDINIISEEIVTASKYKELDIDIKKYAAVPIDTIICNKKNKTPDQALPLDGTIQYDKNVTTDYEHNICNTELLRKEMGHSVNSIDHNYINIEAKPTSEPSSSMREESEQNFQREVYTPVLEILKSNDVITGHNEGEDANSKYLKDFENNNETESTDQKCYNVGKNIHPGSNISHSEFHKRSEKNTEDKKHRSNIQHHADLTQLTHNAINMDKNILSERESSFQTKFSANKTHDKIGEIATYLREFVNICPNEKKKIEKKNNSSKKDFPKPEGVVKETNKSKLCIQGVEKPGGVRVKSRRVKHDITNLKTYGGQGRSLKFHKCELKEKLKQSSLNVIIKTECNQDPNNMSHSYKTKEFCICKDFGQLAYYDSNTIYEHIHFWEAKSAIYNELDDFKNDTECNNDQNHICWHYLAGEEDEQENGVEHNYVPDILPISVYNDSVEHLKRDSNVPVIEDQQISSNNAEIVLDNNTDNMVKNMNIHKSIPKIANDDDKPDENICSLEIPGPIQIEKECLAATIHAESVVQVNEHQVSGINIATPFNTCEIQMHNNILNQVDSQYTPHADLAQTENIVKQDIECVDGMNSFANQIHSAENNLSLPSNSLSQTQINSKISKDSLIATGSPIIPRIQDGEMQNEDQKIKLYTPEVLPITVSNNLVERLNKKSSMPMIKDQQISSNNIEIVSDNIDINIHKNKSILKIPNDDEEHEELCPLETPTPLEIEKESHSIHTGGDAQVKEPEISDINITSVDTNDIQMLISLLYQFGNQYTPNADVAGTVKQDVESVDGMNSSANQIVTAESNLLSMTSDTVTQTTPDSQNIPMSNDREIENEDQNKTNVKPKRVYGKNNVKSTVPDDPKILSEQKKGPSDNNDNLIEQVVSPKPLENCNLVSRKRASRRTQDTSSDEPDSKKTTKCGVCDKLLSEAEWEDHTIIEHCFIAWKVGEDFDFEDEELLRKLRQHLKNIGALKCSLCSVEKKNSKNFLSHVKQCVQSVIEQRIDAPSCSTANESLIECSVTCGVCSKRVTTANWMTHICKEHNYLAWKDTSEAIDLDDDFEVYQHLANICKEIGHLICGKCGIVRKYVKAFMTHIKTCNDDDDDQEMEDTSVCDETETNATVEDEQENNEINQNETTSMVKCGVCDVDVEEANWIVHIGEKHNYLAWEHGTTPLDLDDKKAVQKHLKILSEENGGLICAKCGLRRKTVKHYTSHIEECNPASVSFQANTTADSSNVELNSTLDVSSLNVGEMQPDSTLKCAVCTEQVVARDWIKHIEEKHCYMAWFEGQSPLELDDTDFIHKYLLSIVKKIGALTCSNCDLKRKYPKIFLQHVRTCRKEDVGAVNVTVGAMGEEVQCGVCLEKLALKAFKNHATSKHYDLAWMVGQEPIDLRNGSIVEKYLKLYSRNRNLVCRLCGLSRASCMGFYAHIIACGKTDEEVEKFKDVCEICNNKYLCIYKYQHMKVHRDQELASIRKQEKLAAMEAEKDEEAAAASTGRRRAAEKAKTIIDKYNARTLEDEKEQEGQNDGDAADSDASIKMELSSDDGDDDDDDDDDVDSDISAKELKEREVKFNEYYNKKSKCSNNSMCRLPFEVANPQKYIRQSGKEFAETHFAKTTLFNEWRSYVYQVVPDKEISNYLPLLEHSCSIRFNSDEWMEYKRFEATVGLGACIFTGGCVQCVSWAPNMEDDAGNYVAVATHRSSDLPRHSYDKLFTHHNLIQIWDAGDLDMRVPKLSLGLAHDYGTVWSMSWCPSGARDSLPDTEQYTEVIRLGLLAVACSNGHAYIYSVPYPCTIANRGENIIYKLKPVVELRIESMNRRKYAATSICWSPKQSHSMIVVGYADGTLAYFDLNNDSPLVKTRHNDTIILYPYKDERAQNISIMETAVYPGVSGEAVSVGTAAGAGVRLRARTLHAPAPALAARFAPLWPSLLLAGNTGIMTQPVNEIELCGSGHRRGIMRCWAGCSRCSRLASFQPPTLRVTMLHPADPTLANRRQVIGYLEAVPLVSDRKRKLKTDDGLAVELEPLIYEEVTKKYGLQWKVGSKDRSNPSRSQQPIRFPLADVPRMEFYPSQRHHTHLAVATHAGFVMLLKTP